MPINSKIGCKSSLAKMKSSWVVVAVAWPGSWSRLSEVARCKGPIKFWKKIRFRPSEQKHVERFAFLPLFYHSWYMGGDPSPTGLVLLEG